MSAFDANDHANDHHLAQQALPWLANGTLDRAERERVQSHLRGCARCRADLDLLRAIRDAGPGPAPACDPERALARMLPRLDPAPAPSHAPAAAAPSVGMLERWRARIAANDRRWMRGAMALQACLIAALALLLVRPHAPADDGGPYRGLGASAPAAAAIVVTFRPETPERELRRIVRDSGAHVSGGPTAGDAWLIDGGDTRAVLARLRAEPAVVLAEPLGAEGRP
jgi:anti-sigma factor RsiW